MNERERVLIVDDERFNINVLLDILSTDYESIVAKSGEQALKRLEGEVLPDIILLDVLMPGIDGYEVCSRIKKDPRLKDIPVLFITALDQDHEEKRGLELGAVDYISKPFSPLLVRLRVKNHLKTKRQSDLLRDLANLDGLTGVPNRRRFDEQLDEEWALSTRYRTPLSLILIDIDFFKSYNDTYGHLMGDDCLSKVAKTLLQGVGRPPDLLARYGGEEFVCLLPNTGAEGAKTIGGRLRDAVATLGIPHERSTAEDHVTISLGAATRVASGDERVSVLVNQADGNLYRAKEQGRNRLVT
jgi:diguanylate cyclase (GGDEF)-like protein